LHRADDVASWPGVGQLRAQVMLQLVGPLLSGDDFRDGGPGGAYRSLRHHQGGFALPRSGEVRGIRRLLKVGLILAVGEASSEAVCLALSWRCVHL
jgi:hypothetical protein